MSTGHWFILIALGAAFGSSFGFNEILVSSYGPLTVSAARVGLGAIGCWFWVVATGRRIDLAGGSVGAVVTFGLFQYGAPFALLPLAQQHVTSSVAGIANAMTPVAVVVISHLWPGGERITRTKCVGIACGLAGLIALVGQGPNSGRSEPIFVLIAALAPVCYAVALNFVRQFRRMDPVVMTAIAMTGAAVATAPIAVVVEGLPHAPDLRTIFAFACIGFGLTSAAFLIMYTILPKVGATNVSLVTFVAPVSATIIGASLFREPVGPGHVAGMVLILVGLLAIDGRLWRRFGPIARAAGEAA